MIVSTQIQNDVLEAQDKINMQWATFITKKFSLEEKIAKKKK